nr:hypothetical protein [Serratia fonticola]
MQQELLLLKSVAQLPLQPVYYDGIHELPIDQECVKNLQHTEQACFAKSQSKAVSFAVAPKGNQLLSLEKVFYNEWKYIAAFFPSSFKLQRCYLHYFPPVTYPKVSSWD